MNKLFVSPFFFVFLLAGVFLNGFDALVGSCLFWIECLCVVGCVVILVVVLFLFVEQTQWFLAVSLETCVLVSVFCHVAGISGASMVNQPKITKHHQKSSESQEHTTKPLSNFNEIISKHIIIKPFNKRAKQKQTDTIS